MEINSSKITFILSIVNDDNLYTYILMHYSLWKNDELFYKNAKTNREQYCITYCINF